MKHTGEARNLLDDISFIQNCRPRSSTDVSRSTSRVSASSTSTGCSSSIEPLRGRTGRTHLCPRRGRVNYDETRGTSQRIDVIYPQDNVTATIQDHPTSGTQPIDVPRVLWVRMKDVVPAAGEGTRLRPLTADRLKGLVVVAGRLLLPHCFDLSRTSAWTSSSSSTATGRTRPSITTVMRIGTFQSRMFIRTGDVDSETQYSKQKASSMMSSFS